MSHASIDAVWSKLERRTDLETILLDAVGQYSLELSLGIESIFDENPLRAFHRLVHLIKTAFHLQRTYLQARIPSPNVTQYLLKPTLVFKILCFLLNIKDRYLQEDLRRSHVIKYQVLRSIGGMLLSGLRLLIFLKTKAPMVEDCDWVAKGTILRHRLWNWPLEDTFHRVLINEICNGFLEGLSISVETQLTENVAALCPYHERCPDPGSFLDLPDYNDGLVGVEHSIMNHMNRAK